MNGRCKASATAWTWLAANAEVGPNIAVIPGLTSSHNFLLALKLSSWGYLATSIVTRDLDNTVLSSFTRSIPLWKAVSSAPDCSSKSAAENEYPLVQGQN